MNEEQLQAIKERAYYGDKALLDFNLIQMSQADVSPLIREVERLREAIEKIATHNIFLAPQIECFGEEKKMELLRKENKMLREALEKIAYTPTFERQCDVEAYASQILEG